MKRQKHHTVYVVLSTTTRQDQAHILAQAGRSEQQKPEGLQEPRDFPLIDTANFAPQRRLRQNLRKEKESTNLQHTTYSAQSTEYVLDRQKA